MIAAFREAYTSMSLGNDRLVEKTESHVIIGLLLFFLLLGLLLWLSGSSTTGGSATSCWSSATTTAGWDGGELG